MAGREARRPRMHVHAGHEMQLAFEVQASEIGKRPIFLKNAFQPVAHPHHRKARQSDHDGVAQADEQTHNTYQKIQRFFAHAGDPRKKEVPDIRAVGAEKKGGIHLARRQREYPARQKKQGEEDEVGFIILKK